MTLKQVLCSTGITELPLDEPLLLSPDQTISTASAEMRAHQRGAVLICKDQKLAGIFTERDLIRVIQNGGDMEIPVSNEMSTQPKTLSTEATLLEATQLMAEEDCRRVPIVDHQQQPVGIIDSISVIHFLAELFPETVYNEAPHDQQCIKKPEGA